MKPIPVLLLLSALLSLPLHGAEADTARIQTLVSQRNTEALKTMGPAVLPALAQMYRESDAAGKANVAAMFYQLGWKSPEAKQVLMADLHTSNQSLRIEVQSALGHVSSDVDVVDALLDNMRNDADPLIRDKAACALAYDQIHLTEKQKVRLYEGLINALSDTKLDVRSIAALALVSQTGQMKGFDADAAPARRESAIQEWKKWLGEYRSRW